MLSGAVLPLGIGVITPHPFRDKNTIAQYLVVDNDTPLADNWRMEFDFDPIKDASNRRKHGVSLADAALLDWETAVIWPDMRFDYGEARMSALGHIGNRLC